MYECVSAFLYELTLAKVGGSVVGVCLHIHSQSYCTHSEYGRVVAIIVRTGQCVCVCVFGGGAGAEG